MRIRFTGWVVGLALGASLALVTQAQVPPTSPNAVVTANVTGSMTSQVSTAATPTPRLNATGALNTTMTATSTIASAPLPSTTSPPAPATGSESLPLDTRIDGAFAVLGIVLMLSGAATCGWGHRNRWSSFFVCGFYVLALSTLCAILSLGVEKGVKPPSSTVRGLFLLACLIAGIVGGVLFILFYNLAAFAICGLGGFTLGLWLQALKDNGLIVPLGLRWILLAGCTALFFAIGCIPRAHSAVVLASTAATGATALLLGVDCFSTAGLKEFYIRNLGYQALFAEKYPPTFQNNHFPLVAAMQVELGVMAAVAAMGVAFQSRILLIAKDRVDRIRDVDRDRKLERAAEKAARHISRTAERDLADWEARYGNASALNSQGERSTPMIQEVPAFKLSPPPQVALPRLWLSHTPMQSPAGSDPAELEKPTEPARSALPTTSFRKSAQGSFMAYVNGQSSPPLRGGIGRKGAKQDEGMLPAVDPGKALGLTFTKEVSPKSLPVTLPTTESQKTVMEERNEILKQIAKIRASLSELQRAPQESQPSPPVAVSVPASPHTVEAGLPLSSKASSAALPSVEQHGAQGKPVNASTFAWVQSMPQPQPQPQPVYQQARAAHSHSHSHSTFGETSETRRQSAGERIITGTVHSRRGSQMTLGSSGGRHTPTVTPSPRPQSAAITPAVVVAQSMSIEELQSRHRERMRSRQRSVNDVLALQTARAEWEQRQVEERARMSDKVQQHGHGPMHGHGHGHRQGRGQRTMSENGKLLVVGGSASVGRSGGAQAHSERMRARSIDWQHLSPPEQKRARATASTQMPTTSADSQQTLATFVQHQQKAIPGGQHRAARRSMGL